MEKDIERRKGGEGKENVHRKKENKKIQKEEKEHTKKEIFPLKRENGGKSH